MSDFGNASYILYRLQSEIQTQYITRKQNLLKTIYTYIANEKTDKNDVSYSLYGTNSFNLVWEKVCADNFGSVLDKKIVDLPLSNQEWNKVDYKDKTLRKVIKSPRWRKTEFPDVEDPKVETLKPDLVCIYPVDEQKKDYCFGIYDAKYYCIDYQIHGDKAIISGQPGVGDVTKQYLYQLAFDDFIMKQGYRYVQNMFFCPDEVGDKQYGWVQMEILNHIGNKRLENIAVVKLCASKMYQLYLDNQTISEHEINQYIPDIGRQEISEQNFANRMMAYLMRITNASKMAEEKLEMKADQGKLIYPRQIKRELGAKIIYDAICPVASKAFYGFNPYEKENYGNMVAEDIGNSYGRCNQIADVSIEIEKKIKELSEKELQDEKVIIDILRKCFKDKEDILKKYFPFIEVIVITQNEIAPDYETISKYDPKCGKTPVEYYDEKLPPILDQCIRNIFEVRKITSELQKNTSWEKVMVEKIVNSVNGQGKFDEFTKNDIDDVIKMFQELQTKVEG